MIDHVSGHDQRSAGNCLGERFATAISWKDVQPENVLGNPSASLSLASCPLLLGIDVPLGTLLINLALLNDKLGYLS